MSLSSRLEAQNVVVSVAASQGVDVDSEYEICFCLSLHRPETQNWLICFCLSAYRTDTQNISVSVNVSLDDPETQNKRSVC